MNEQFKVEPCTQSIECVRDYLFTEIKKVIADREVEVFAIQNKYGKSDKNRELIDWINGSRYARVFSRVVIGSTLRNEWATISVVITKLGCDDKTARNLYQKFMDYKMIYRDLHSSCLKFKATPEAMDLFDVYCEELYCKQGDYILNHLLDLAQYIKILQKHGTQYQEKRE